MAGIFGSDSFDVYREEELNRHLDSLNTFSYEDVKTEAIDSLKDILTRLEYVINYIDENIDIDMADNLSKSYTIIDRQKTKLNK